MKPLARPAAGGDEIDPVGRGRLVNETQRFRGAAFALSTDVTERRCAAQRLALVAPDSLQKLAPALRHRLGRGRIAHIEGAVDRLPFALAPRLSSGG